GSLQHAIDKMAADSIRADYTVSLANGRPLSTDVEAKLTATQQVTAISPLRSGDSRVDNKSESLTGVNGATIGELTNLTIDKGALKVSGTRVVVDEDTAKDHRWTVGSRFTAAYEDGTKQTLTVAGIYEGNVIIRGIMVDNATLTPHLTDPTD